MPSEVSIAGAHHDRESTVEELKRELAEAREQQAATAEILTAISSSPTDAQRAFAEIAASAARLCDAYDAGIFQVEGDSLRTVAHHGPISMPDTLPLTREVSPGRAVLDRRTIHIADLQAEADEFPDGSVRARHLGFRTILNVPLMRGDDSTGVISIRRTDVRPFTDRQVNLLKIFADQAVIAIENTRLFEAEQASKRELHEALKRQTATSDVLSVISSSPGELAPVFKAMLANAVRICNAKFGFMNRYDGDTWKIAAVHGAAPAYTEYLQQHGYKRPGPETIVARIAKTKQMVHIADLAESRGYVERDDVVVAAVERGGVRTLLGVPMLKKDELIGAILLYHQEVRPFTEKQIELVTNFANQAVIAIENTRLFDEVQARNRALADANKQLTETLEQQTATSELLKVIGRSTFDSQPVFETLAENAVRLCEAERSIIYRFDGQFLRVVAIHNATPELRAFVEQNPVAPGRSGAAARAVLERRTVQILDVQTDPEYSYGVRQVDPVRTVIAVPILKGDELLGLILIYRLEVRAFTESQVALLETFADQAGIAIENARLFEEVQARNRDLTALGQVGRAVGSTLDLNLVLKTIVDRAVELSETDGGSIFYYRKGTGRFQLGETTGLDAQVVGRIRNLDIAAGKTGLDEAIVNRQPLQLTDLTKRASNPLRDVALEAGLHAALIVPLLGSEGALGALVLQRRRTGDFPPSVVSLMQSFADQSAIALENARLFDEIAQKSRELEIASQHKSQFVANMSHELRTPLAAILGYAELIQEGFYGPLPDKALDSLTRIRSNGKHLLGLINTVLDIAKIESGQFTLNMAEYDIDSVVETVLGRIWVESTLGKGSTFQMELPTRAEFRKTGS
jgi:GAF domain-containing protein